MIVYYSQMKLCCGQRHIGNIDINSSWQLSSHNLILRTRSCQPFSNCFILVYSIYLPFRAAKIRHLALPRPVATLFPISFKTCTSMAWLGIDSFYEKKKKQDWTAFGPNEKSKAKWKKEYFRYFIHIDTVFRPSWCFRKPGACLSYKSWELFGSVKLQSTRFERLIFWHVLEEDCEVWWLRTSALRRYKGACSNWNRHQTLKDFW